MGDREAILARLKKVQGSSPRPTAAHPRTALTATLDEELIQRMTANTASVVRLQQCSEVPAWVAQYISDNLLPATVVCGLSKTMAGLPWPAVGIELEQRAAVASDLLALSRASCGIAESGTLLLPSGPDNPTTLNFLPDHHVVLLSTQDIVSHWEEAWALCRRQWSGALPRVLNCISGPSSTADVGLTQVFGAHGPRNLSVLLIDE